VQKTENLLHDVLEAGWQKEFATEDTHAGLQDHNTVHEQALQKATDSIHSISKLGMSFIFSFVVSWSLVLLDKQEHVEVSRLAKDNHKNAHNPGTQTRVATEGRSVKIWCIWCCIFIPHEPPQAAPLLTTKGLPSGLEKTRGVVEHYRAPVQEEQPQRTPADEDSVKSALSFLTIMCEVWQVVSVCCMVSSSKTARKQATQ
jgi:hypothetical protein